MVLIVILILLMSLYHLQELLIALLLMIVRFYSSTLAKRWHNGAELVRLHSHYNPIRVAGEYKLCPLTQKRC